MQSPTGASTATSPSAIDELVAAFLAGTLPGEAWTHPAHLFVCHHLLETASPDEVLADLRVRITAHNERVGLVPGHGGYHETITRYFVHAVAERGQCAPPELLAMPSCQRDAPLRHWSPETLASPDARRRWVEPDRDPLPWTRRP
jgi:hypothetical protein